jgi:heavy metal translocating P-type ATPase
LALIVSAVALVFQLFGKQAIANALLIGVILIELVPLVWGMLRDIRDGNYGVDILAAIAITTSLIMGEYWAGVVIVLMLTGGEALEDYAGHRAENELEALLTRAPQKANILRGRNEIEVSASEVRAGDKMVIRAGDIVAVDALILDGTASFDESSLTGESLPQSKSNGDDILSGSINLDGPVMARALHSAADSQYQQIIRMVKSARHSKAPFVRVADVYAIPFTLFALTFAGLAWALSADSMRFLQVLVVATPCPLILAAPIAIISGMSRAAKHGIIMKNGGALERLAAAKTFAFDKTGTLTRGQPVIGTITTFGSFKESDVLGLAASLEQKSNHSIAAAIVDKAQAEKIKLPKIKDVREIAGQGLVATVRSEKVVVGRPDLLIEENVTLPTDFRSQDIKTTVVCAAHGGKLAGIIRFTDEIRPETEATLAKLRNLGIKNFLMVTGDTRPSAEKVAGKLGIQNVTAGAMPADKIQAVENEKVRPVAFVGDGVNDAPVLAASDVGVALGARGAPAASESADVVVMLDNLEHVAMGTSIAKRTMGIAKQSIWIGIALSVILMGVYATGRFSPVSGAAIQELVDVVVIINALRAHGGKRNNLL